MLKTFNCALPEMCPKCSCMKPHDEKSIPYSSRYSMLKPWYLGAKSLLLFHWHIPQQGNASKLFCGSLFFYSLPLVTAAVVILQTSQKRQLRLEQFLINCIIFQFMCIFKHRSAVSNWKKHSWKNSSEQ